jgi:alpha-glucosidase
MNLWRKIIIGLRFIGLGNVLRSVIAGFQRDWLDWRFRSHQLADQPVLAPGRTVAAKAFPWGMVINFELAELEIHFLAPDIVRLSWGPGAPPLPHALEKTEWDQVDISTEETPQGWLLKSANVQVLVGDRGQVEFSDFQDRVLRVELPPRRHGESWTHLSRLVPGEQIHGLGERAAPFNLRPGTYQMWNRGLLGDYRSGEDPLYISIPVYMARHPQGDYLVFYENTHDGVFSFGGQDIPASESFAEVNFAGGMLRYYFIPGPPERALDRYTQLTGRPPLPPRWSLGYHQSRWGYKSTADVRRIAAQYLEQDFPLSAIHLDIDYMDNYKVLTVDEERFPDLGALAGELAAQNVRLVTILDVGIKRDSNFPLYQEGKQRGAFLTTPDGKIVHSLVWPGWCAYPDFSDPKVRDWWAEKYALLLDAGVAGIWHDMNEPSAIVAWGRPSLPFATRYNMAGRGADHHEAGNLYALLMNQTGYQALEAYHPDQRAWLLTRSGWASLQRYAWTWTGDTESTWEALRQTVATILGLGISGIPYTGPDIGGFSGDPDAELYLRWFQMGTFLPFFRVHSSVGTPPREPWTFGEPYTSIIREFLKLRYRLIPYLYTLAWEAHQRGCPFVRPLFWEFCDDPSLSAVEDAFMVGDALMVAPIFNMGQRTRSVVLPNGKWYSIWDGSQYTGPGTVEISAPIEQIPVLVRAGTVLPMESGESLVLNIFIPPKPDPGYGESLPYESKIYNDVGDGYGAWRVDHFKMQWQDNALDIKWDAEGDYPFPYKQVSVLVYGASIQTAILDGTQVSCQENSLETRVFTHLRIENLTG